LAGYTSKDVARVAGVSQSTVSYVMSGKRPISERTRRRVLEAIETLTYQPNAGARALASQRTSVIGLVLPFGAVVDTAALVPFIETITSSARARDHDVLLVASDEGSAGLRRLAGRSLCDAILVMNVQSKDERVPVAASLPVPVVFIGVPDDPAGLHCVDLDFALAGRLAVGELAATGHERIVIVEHPAEMIERNLSFVDRFLDAARDEADGHALPYQVVVPSGRGRRAAAVVVEDVLRSRGNRRQRAVVPIRSPSADHPDLGRVARPGPRHLGIGICTDAEAAESEPQITNLSWSRGSVQPRDADPVRALDPTGVPAPPVIDLIPPRLTRRDTVGLTVTTAHPPTRRGHRRHSRAGRLPLEPHWQPAQ
jgi:DNA-binding LacI/PurR family transcriptional regulator